MPPAQFWESTPRQISASFVARNAVYTRQHNERAWLAYYSGALSRPLKKYPTLESLQIRKIPQRRQSWQEQLAIAQMWTARNHGKIGKVS